jgi:hypothetical protein
MKTTSKNKTKNEGDLNKKSKMKTNSRKNEDDLKKNTTKMKTTLKKEENKLGLSCAKLSSSWVS